MRHHVPLTKAEIRQQLPDRHRNFDDVEYIELSSLQEVYGPHLVELTHALARDLQGMPIHVIYGTGMTEVDPDASKADRMQWVGRLKILCPSPPGWIVEEADGHQFETASDGIYLLAASWPIYVFIR